MTTPVKKTSGARKTTSASAPVAKKAETPKTASAPVAQKIETPKAVPTPAVKKVVATKKAPTSVAKKVAAPKKSPAPVAQKIEAPKAVSAPVAKTEKLPIQTQKGYNDMFTQAQEQMQKMFNVEGSNPMKSFEDVIAMSKSNVDAFVQASTIASKGVQDVANLVAEITKSTIEGNVEVSKKIMECKTPQEAVELQTEAAKASYEKMIVDSKRITEASQKITEEATKPLAEVYTTVAEKFNVKVA